MRDLKAMLERDVVLPLQEPEIYARYRLGLPNGILLYGPPGCGKTFIARKLAEVAGFNFMEVTPGDIASISARLALSQNRLISNGDILNAAGNNPPAHTAAAIEEMRDK